MSRFRVVLVGMRNDGSIGTSPERKHCAFALRHHTDHGVVSA